MAGSFDFSLSGLTQEGHEVDVTVISDSDQSDDNWQDYLSVLKHWKLMKNWLKLRSVKKA